jgi:hypothetical protein
MVLRKILIGDAIQDRYLKYLLILFTLIMVPTYIKAYGLQNFLWLSDVGLFLTIAALLYHSVFLMSCAAVGVLVFEIIWNVDYFVELFLGYNLFNLAHYMFDASYPLALRALSAFHIPLPAIWIYYLTRYGYDQRAWYYFTLLYWIIIFITVTFTAPADNINWAFLPHVHGYQIHPFLWALLLCIFYPLCVVLPTHYVFKKLFKSHRLFSLKYQDN